MVRTIYLVDGIEVSEDTFHKACEGVHQLEAYCECLECGKKLLVCEGCDCQFDIENIDW